MLRYLGYFAGFLTVMSLLPQVIRTWRTRETKDLSLGTFALLIFASICWLLYGVGKTDWSIIATNGGMVMLNLALVVAKLRFK